jgi:hypothetical protein
VGTVSLVASYTWVRWSGGEDSGLNQDNIDKLSIYIFHYPALLASIKIKELDNERKMETGSSWVCLKQTIILNSSFWDEGNFSIFSFI